MQVVRLRSQDQPLVFNQFLVQKVVYIHLQQGACIRYYIRHLLY